jgi:hypothetical protein
MTHMTREGPGRYVAEIATVPVRVFRVDGGWALQVDGLDSGRTWPTKWEAVDAIPRHVEAYIRKSEQA